MAMVCRNATRICSNCTAALCLLFSRIADDNEIGTANLDPVVMLGVTDRSQQEETD
jgi:hypothetical protein